MIRYIFLLGIAMLLSCSYTQPVRNGRMAVEFKQYSKAIPLLKKEFKKADTRVERGQIALLLAESYEATHQSEASIDWYETAWNNQGGIDALEGYARALKQSGRYTEAAQAFKELGLEIGSPYEYRREIEACRLAQGWQQIERPQYEVSPLDWNSSSADYAPVLTPNGSRLVFSSDRNAATGEDTYNWTGKKFSDLFAVDVESGNVQPFSAVLNTASNEGTAAFSPDGQRIIFSRCASKDKRVDGWCQLYSSRRVGDDWEVARPLSFMQEGINYFHPSLSQDGKRLYFSSDDPDGWGGYDLYVSDWDGMEWSDPRLLGRTINTPGNEQFPTVDQDTLYFSSDYWPGMGGLDIFKVFRYNNGQWGTAINLQPPLNSPRDDFAYVIDRSERTPTGILQAGYFTSNRPSGLGGDDIYRFEKKVLPPAPPQPVVDTQVVYKILLDVYVLEKIYTRPEDPNSRLLGRKPLGGALLSVLSPGVDDRKVTIQDDGLLTIELLEDTDYTFLASRDGYLTNEASFSSRGIGRDPNQPVQKFELEIVLDKIYTNQEVTLENIYYDFDKANIRSDAEPTLRALARNLQLNPDIQIELASHTDCRGNVKYNETLSRRRAESAVQFLINYGIDPDRLRARGYGESQPAVECVCARCTDDQHQANRRTTFRVLE